MRKFLLFSFLISFALLAKEPKTYGNYKVKKLISVYDGDTFKVNVEKLPPIIGKEILIRIAGIDTPEIKTKNSQEKIMALEAKVFVEEKLKNAKEIMLVNIRRDKYFRILADVFIDQENLGEELLKNNLAKPYFGKTKPTWP